MSTKTKGIIFGIIAAVCYGTNPLGVLFLYKEGLNTVSTVFYRYFMAVLMLAVALVLKGENFKITKRELGISALLGVFFGISSLALYASFNYTDAGVASTILFCYPVMVSVIMAVFFHEKVSLVTVTALLLSSSGILLLSKGGGNVSMTGVLLVVLSSLSYAIYIVAVNRMKVKISNVKLTFFITLCATPMFVLYSFFGEGNALQILPNISAVFWAAFLGFFPTVLSRVFMNVSIKLSGTMPVLENYILSKHAVQINLHEITEPGNYTVPLRYVLPANLQLVEKSDDELTITVIKKTEEKADSELNSANAAAAAGEI